ncbi:MAG TPA: insulinase family protein [Tenuifilaceae bacterium]|nr:insulinase family protein [Tenuifilaceae bacterium]HPE19033.1 insulinase family protein [Tenuifilaceae bacterium]HPJ46453.1 insulinase family protein [Tenuifilaceae bacterium]HPQ33934.1 insulinase family protein [Tenuifilaceae bacterium]HRX67890.1 insulinase family protein [Tenuifilaceae bacterium]
MKKIVLLSLLFLTFTLKGQISTFKLDNGLTVIVNEDSKTPSIFGSIVVKAGSVDEPTDATGLAHYLEHMLFKGSQNVGTTDWEKEKVHYEKIIELYDQLALAPEEEREAIQLKINEESLLAGQYTINNEFSNLVQAMGGTALNAATSYDMTYYFNVFPSFMLKKWLVLQADRYENPVFRGFQAELETVYEEKNMYSDDPFQVLFEEFNHNLYGEGNPYSRSIIGVTEHLKTPSISKLIEFYNTFYIPSNMALVLSGDIKADEAKKLVEETLGKWEPKKDIQRNKIAEPVIEEKITVKSKLTPMPVLMMGYKGAPSDSDDSYKLEVLSSVLTNSNKTGILDKIVLDGDVQHISVSVSSQRQAGGIRIFGIPVYDGMQRTYGSLSSVEKIIQQSLEELMNGQIDDWLIESVKDEFILDFELSKESNLSYGMMLAQAYGNDMTVEELENYIELIKQISKEDVIAVAKKYLDKPYLAFHSHTGEPKKDKLPKPEYKPIVPAAGKTSAFAKLWLDEKVEVPPFKPIDFNNDFSKGELAQGVTLFHAENPESNIFSLTLKYGAGSAKIPGLDFSVSLMNRAGIMALYTPYELKREFSKLGCTVYFSNDRSYTYVNLIGNEDNLLRACKLLSSAFLMPSMDEKQRNSLIGNQLGSRMMESKDKDMQSDALNEYIKYGENSRYLNRLTNSEVLELSVSKLAANFIEATKYETSVHYTGKLSYNEVKDVLTKSLAFPSNLKKSDSPVSIATTKYSENTIFLLNNKSVRQGDIYIFGEGDEYQHEQRPVIDAFNQYFGGGFNGLVLQELRELRSFAYTASANYSIPPVPGRKSMFTGYIGTQGDKTLDAVNEFLNLIKSMPEHPERMGNIKDYLFQATVSSSPTKRQLTQVVENWMQSGYKEDPRIKLVEGYNATSFEEMMEFYNQKFKEKPIAIGIVVNTKLFDKKQLKTIGKVVNISSTKIFKY